MFARRSRLEQPRFPDGELDLWPQAKDQMPNRAATDTPTKKECEERRHELANKLGSYATLRGTSLFVTHPDNVRIVDGAFHDIWGFGLEDDGRTGIQIPRYVVGTRPGAGDVLEFRPEVPGFVILGSWAHELAHRDRALRDPERHRTLFAGFRSDNRHEIDLSRVRDEEMATDIEAYGILQANGIPLTPDDYVATVPISSGYHEELARSIAEVA